MSTFRLKRQIYKLSTSQLSSETGCRRFNLDPVDVLYIHICSTKGFNLFGSTKVAFAIPFWYKYNLISGRRSYWPIIMQIFHFYLSRYLAVKVLSAQFGLLAFLTTGSSVFNLWFCSVLHFVLVLLASYNQKRALFYVAY